MIKNNIFDKNQRMNENIYYGKKRFNASDPSFVVNLDVLSTGVKSDLEQKKVGSDTRSYLDYHN